MSLPYKRANSADDAGAAPRPTGRGSRRRRSDGGRLHAALLPRTEVGAPRPESKARPGAQLCSESPCVRCEGPLDRGLNRIDMAGAQIAVLLSTPNRVAVRTDLLHVRIPLAGGN